MNERRSLFKEKWCTEVGRACLTPRSIVAFTLFLALGCGNATPAAKTLTLATTTSTQDSGLLDELVPLFREQTGIEVKVVAVGTGQALELGRRGDADVLLTHAPAAEQTFMTEGYGSERRPVMHNDFVLAGPNADPAQVKRQTSVIEAFQRIAQLETAFVSRGDNSGTHQKEREVWTKAGVEPKGKWYLQAGNGMAQVLRLASEKHAYVLTDRATFLALRAELSLDVLLQGDDILLNRYAVTVVNPRKHAHVRHQAASQFAAFLCSRDIQDEIGAFGKKKYGEALFFPNAEK